MMTSHDCDIYVLTRSSANHVKISCIVFNLSTEERVKFDSEIYRTFKVFYCGFNPLITKIHG